ncbi:transformer-2 protein homolog beta-like [Adelges cooleyi]|uniref:transformer-2 protein homolog beta-like n=1 Tax=Adelges cooleyi TaxID=133065 RepID=UPI00218054C7|nr:transformer-2 protein homolog beta-like [Adelges cooleyi]
MSNAEDHENKSKSRSLSPNKSASQCKSNSRSSSRSKSKTHSPNRRNGYRSKTRSKSKTHSPSCSNGNRSKSRSKSKTLSPGCRNGNRSISRSKSKTHSPGRRNGNRSETRSKSRSRARSCSRERRRRSRRHRSRRSGSRRSKYDNSKANRCLGIFGLNHYTSQNQLYNIFSKYGAIERVSVIIDAKTGRSRGFGFAYFKNYNEAKKAKDGCTGMEIDGREIRVDFSLTHRPRTPTPGIYMGNRTRRPTRRHRYDRGYQGSRFDRDRDYHNSDYYDGRYRDRSRSRSRGNYRDDRSPPSYYKAKPYHARSHSRSYSPR